jgi:6-phosphofructo-2-kinase
MLERNFRLKLSGPDYKNRDPVKALADFRSRVENYEKAYEPIGDWEEENDIQFCKIINVGKKVIAYNISGYLSGQCIFYLMNFNLVGKLIMLIGLNLRIDIFYQNVKSLSHDMAKVKIM